VLVTAFLANVPDHVYFKDRDSRFVAVSASMVRLFGRSSADEIIGRTDFDFFAESHARPAFEDEQRIIRTGQPILGLVEKEVWPDGHVTWVQSSKLPLRDAAGAIIGTFGISKDITQAKQTEAVLEDTRKDLLDASRRAGMAEVASGVLHNVGNVLTSVNVSASMVAQGLHRSKVDALVKVAALLREHTGDAGEFLNHDPRGRKLPAFLESLGRHFVEERARLLEEVRVLQESIDHIKEIVAMQQDYATTAGVVEPHDAATLFEDALRMNTAALARHEVTVVRDFPPVPPVVAERGKVLQILVNLIRNAKYALDDGRPPEKVLSLRIESPPGGRVRLVVQDNGIGIPAENLARIFAHGFTTRKGGHGFGLHSSALAARESQGSLSVQSDGPGTGATFVLELPAAPAGAVPVNALAPAA
jgi:PAS domain S-box-containing protein